MVQVMERSTYVWSHLAIITFHVLIALILFYLNSSYSKSVLKNAQRTKYINVTAAILLIVSLLGLIPIVRKTESIHINA